MASRTVSVSSLTAICLLLGLPRATYAANRCPWLTEATASGLIGADAAGSYVAGTGSQPAVCTFTEKSQIPARTLTITVEVASDPHARMTAVARICGDGAAPLTAIGNEAVYCSVDLRHGELGERAVGRVRDQVFTITLNSTMKDDPILTREILKTRIYTAAEQVAGNLF
jgi:hypothetical protein